MKGKFLRAWFNKWRKIGSRVIPCAGCECSCQSMFWCSANEDNAIPRDVPKGHLVVYVGKDYKRFVIKITLVNHPLFKALLDRMQDEHDFNAESKLCIHCDESLFLHVLRAASSPAKKARSLASAVPLSNLIDSKGLKDS